MLRRNFVGSQMRQGASQQVGGLREGSVEGRWGRMVGEDNAHRNYIVLVVDIIAYAVDVARVFFAVRRFPVG